jgi:hypothetical protein
MWSISLIHYNVMLWHAWNSNRLAWSRPLSSACLWTIFSKTFSNNLLVMDKRLIRRRIGGNLGSLAGFGKLSPVLPSKTSGGVKAEYSDYSNVLGVPIVSLEGVWGMHLECDPSRSPFSISGNLLISVYHMVWLFQGAIVCSFEQSLNSSLHLLFMVIVTLVMGCELNFQSSCWPSLMDDT